MAPQAMRSIMPRCIACGGGIMFSFCPSRCLSRENFDRRRTKPRFAPRQWYRWIADFPEKKFQDQPFLRHGRLKSGNGNSTIMKI